MLPFKLFRLVFFPKHRTLCFDIEAKLPVSAETSFGSSFGCFEFKLVSKDNLALN